MVGSNLELNVMVHVNKPKKIIFNPPATICLWEDGTKTVVKCRETDNWNAELGLAMCICKRIMGTKDYHEVFKQATDYDDSWKSLTPEDVKAILGVDTEALKEGVRKLNEAIKKFCERNE